MRYLQFLLSKRTFSPMGLGLGLRLGGRTGGPGITSLSMTGLDTNTPNDAATPGDHASISVGYPSGVTSWTSEAWGVGTFGDDTYGTGANPTDYTASDGLNLLWEGLGDDGNTYRASAPIRYAVGTAPAVADGQNWTVDDTSVSLDGSASGANLTFSYGLSGAPAGVSIHASTGAISGTPTAVASGTITITATDQYGRELTDTFTFTSALRSQATGGTDLDLSYEEDSAITPQDLLANWTDNGNTLTFVSVSPSLPTGLSINSSGTLSGTPTTITADDTYTLTMEDEYGRETSDTFTLEITEVDATAPTASSVAFGTQEADGDLPLTVTDLSENSTIGIVFTSSDQSAATAAAIKTAAEGGTGLTDQLSIETQAVTTGGGPYTISDGVPTGQDGTVYYQIVFWDAADNVSAKFTGSVTIDSTAPGITSYSPADNATDVAVDATLSIVFNESMKTSGTSATVTLKNVGGATIETFDPDSDGTWSTTTNANDTWTVTPTSDFTNEATLAVQYSGFEDTNGNVVSAVSDDTTWNFTVVAASSSLDMSYIEEVNVTTSLGISTTTSINIGTADSDREIIVAISSYSAVVGLTADGVSGQDTPTIGGVTATMDQRGTPDGTANTAIIRAAVPTGTSANLVIDWVNDVLTATDTPDEFTVRVFRVVKSGGVSVTDTFVGKADTPTSPYAMDLDVAEGGAIVGTVQSRGHGNQDLSFTGITDRGSVVDHGINHPCIAGFDTGLSAATPFSLDCEWTGGMAEINAIAVSYE